MSVRASTAVAPVPGLMRVAIGSTSTSKIQAARTVFGRAFPGAQVEAVPIPSSVRAQPIGDDETIRGAEHRARDALRTVKADFGIGIEGGVHADTRGVWMCVWVAVAHRDGRESLGGGLRLRLPEWLAARALAGEEVGVIVDTLLGHEEAHEELGAIGMLTAGLVDRQSALEQALAAALAPFLAAPLFEQGGGLSGSRRAPGDTDTGDPRKGGPGSRS